MQGIQCGTAISEPPRSAQTQKTTGPEPTDTNIHFSHFFLITASKPCLIIYLLFVVKWTCRVMFKFLKYSYDTHIHSVMNLLALFSAYTRVNIDAVTLREVDLHDLRNEIFKMCKT